MWSSNARLTTLLNVYFCLLFKALKFSFQSTYYSLCLQDFMQAPINNVFYRCLYCAQAPNLHALRLETQYLCNFVMHVPCQLFELRCFVFVFQYNFKQAFNSNKNVKQRLIKLLICFLERLSLWRCQIITMYVYCAGADLPLLINKFIDTYPTVSHLSVSHIKMKAN